MRTILRTCLALVCLLAAATASASFHTFQIEQIFSNADGTVQFCVMHEASGLNDQEFWAGHPFTSTRGGVTNPYFFPNDLPSSQTRGRRVLIATQGFAALGLVTPDYVVSNGFFSTGSGIVNFAGVDQVSYSSLPTDGVHGIDHNGNTVQNLATNFSGASASVSVPAANAVNYTGLWYIPQESGWGINFMHQGDIVFATWFTYDLQGNPWWLIAELHKTADGVYTGPVSTVAGPPFNAVPFPPEGAPGGAIETLVGMMTVTFADASHTTIDYKVNGTSQTKSAVLQVYATPPVCTWGGVPNFAQATNFQGLWWIPQESGWGINFTHQGDIIFATWFTYDMQGNPWWLIAELHKSTGFAYSGQVSTLTGPAFNAVPFPPEGSPGGAIETVVGSATLTFADGNTAAFDYTVNGASQTKNLTRQVFVEPGTVCQ